MQIQNLTSKQVAVCLGMHPKTFERKLRNNEIALISVKSGRFDRFRPQDVERYMELHEVARDGSGKKRKKAKAAKKFLPLPHAETLAFFDGIDIIDGCLECQDDDDFS